MRRRARALRKGFMYDAAEGGGGGKVGGWPRRSTAVQVAAGHTPGGGRPWWLSRERSLPSESHLSTPICRMASGSSAVRLFTHGGLWGLGWGGAGAVGETAAGPLLAAAPSRGCRRSWPRVGARGHRRATAPSTPPRAASPTPPAAAATPPRRGRPHHHHHRASVALRARRRRGRVPVGRAHDGGVRTTRRGRPATGPARHRRRRHRHRGRCHHRRPP